MRYLGGAWRQRACSRRSWLALASGWPWLARRGQCRPAGDGAVVLAGRIGVCRAGNRTRQWVRWALAALVAGLGGWLLATGVMSLAGG